ncbi:Uncharacterised protein [Chlamydia trachomatis]|nr:Uncharacterised protein [Chlamydia trachomatis]
MVDELLETVKDIPSEAVILAATGVDVVPRIICWSLSGSVICPTLILSAKTQFSVLYK